MLENTSIYCHEYEAYKYALLGGRPPAHEIFANSSMTHEKLEENYNKAADITKHSAHESAFQFLACQKLDPFHPLSLPMDIVKYIVRLELVLAALSFDEFLQMYRNSPYGEIIRIRAYEKLYITALWSDEKCHEPDIKYRISQIQYIDAAIRSLIYPHTNSLSVLEIGETFERWLEPHDPQQWITDTNRLAFEILGLGPQQRSCLARDNSSLSVNDQSESSGLGHPEPSGWSPRISISSKQVSLAIGKRDVIAMEKLMYITERLSHAAFSQSMTRNLFKWVLGRKRNEYEPLICCVHNLKKSIQAAQYYVSSKTKNATRLIEAIGKYLSCIATSTLEDTLLKMVQKSTCEYSHSNDDSLEDAALFFMAAADSGFDFNTVRGAGGSTLLGWAASQANDTLTKVLLEHGADVNAVNSVNDTPLIVAVANNYDNDRLEGIVRLLLMHNAAVAHQGEHGNTAIHELLIRGECGKFKEKILKVLLSKPCKNICDIYNDAGDTPLTLAMNSFNSRLAEMIGEHAALPGFKALILATVDGSSLRALPRDILSIITNIYTQLFDFRYRNFFTQFMTKLKRIENQKNQWG
jgi:hypothetical protein